MKQSFSNKVQSLLSEIIAKNPEKWHDLAATTSARILSDSCDEETCKWLYTHGVKPIKEYTADELAEAIIQDFDHDDFDSPESMIEQIKKNRSNLT